MSSSLRDGLMRSLSELGLSVKAVRTEHRRLYLVIDHLTYPNVEAHLFTAADAAGWKPEFLVTDDVRLTRSRGRSHDDLRRNWVSLIEALRKLSRYLQPFQERIRQGDLPSVIWSHAFRGWHRRSWEAPVHPIESPDRFIHYVDVSIRKHITKLNELGFGTMESCSGLLKDHPDREPYWPYVMFDERTYPGIAPHLFTLADIAGWIPTLAPHNFDIYVKVRRGDDIPEAWRRLVGSAVKLDDLLHEYRERAKKLKTWNVTTYDEIKRRASLAEMCSV